MKTKQQLKIRRNFKLDADLDKKLSKASRVQMRTKTSIVEEGLRGVLKVN